MIVDNCTFEKLGFEETAINEVPQCALDAIPMGVPLSICDEEEGPITDTGDVDVKGPGVIGGGDGGIDIDLGLAPFWRRGNDGGACLRTNTCAEAVGDCNKDYECAEGLRCCHREPFNKDRSNNASLRSFEDNSCPGINIPEGWHVDIDLCFDPTKAEGYHLEERSDVRRRSRR